MEKRNKGRIGKRLFVRFGTEKAERVGFTDDISSDGLFIKSNGVFPPGTILRIELTLPDQRIIRLVGRVMWSKQVPPSLIRYTKKSGIGIRITETNEEYKQFMESFRKDSTTKGG